MSSKKGRLREVKGGKIKFQALLNTKIMSYDMLYFVLKFRCGIRAWSLNCGLLLGSSLVFLYFYGLGLGSFASFSL